MCRPIQVLETLKEGLKVIRQVRRQELRDGKKIFEAISFTSQLDFLP